MTLGNFDIGKKFAGPHHYKISTVWQQNLTPSWTNWTWKSAFPDFHGNKLEIHNSDFTTTLSDPDRLSVPNFVKIHQETAEELGDKKSIWGCLPVSFLLFSIGFMHPRFLCCFNVMLSPCRKPNLLLHILLPIFVIKLYVSVHIFTIIIDREAREIICLVTSVRPFIK